MSAPFPTKWDFLFATVLIGVNRADGSWTSYPDAQGQPTVAVFTTEEAALDVPEDRFAKQAVQVTQLVGMVPPGLGFSVNPGSPGGVAGESMHVDATMVASLKHLLPPLPAKAELDFRVWVDVAPSLYEALKSAMAATPQADGLWALSYTIEDSPYLGMVAYDARRGGDGVVADAIVGALNAGPEPLELGVASVQVVAWSDLPRDVRKEFMSSARIYHR